MYRTGDQGYWRPDGSIAFVGRVDHQIKIRGHLVNLTEVEGCLDRHPAIAAAVAVTRAVHKDQAEITAYIVPSCTTDPPSLGDLRDFIRDRLPSYMQPSQFVVLESIPMRGGKVDRQGLPVPTATNTLVSKVRSPAEDALQARLVGIWERILDVRPIGIDDNFTSLGGDSLLALTLLWQIAEELQCNLNLSDIEEAETIRQLATVIVSVQG